ncbi:MAG: radical SAM protein [Nanoarchaeota archaeon]|nr:radical SAM protein [Nanoarchaeota archaeon]
MITQKNTKKDTKDILFICLPSTINIFKNSKISIAVPLIPLISIAQLAAVSREAGYTPHVLDLSVKKTEGVRERIICALRDLNPDYCGITFTTPLSSEADKVANLIKKVSPSVITIAGGSHASSMPKDTLKSRNFDIAVMGEGEITLKEILLGKRLQDIDGIAYYVNSKVFINKHRQLISNLDALPFPDYSIFNNRDYHTPRLNCRKNPVIAMETSRGCVYGCIYCSKCVFQRVFRAKSPKRTVDEMEHILSFGYKEVHIWDDGFSTDIGRAKEICREIIRRKLDITWNIYNGLRVDRLDEELLNLLKKSGCYRISIGVESGNQKILDSINKGTKLQDIEQVFKLANQVGIETIAFCMIGFPNETEQTMKDTINFILRVKPSIAKLSILMPLPGTPIFDKWDKEGRIISKEWSDYVFHLPQKVYNHPNLSWDVINHYYHLFYRRTMLNSNFLYRRILRDIRQGELFIDVYYFLKSLKWGW